ncbi:MAG: DUF4019 domain-containing protein [Candidatus Sumerlaeaceae bacterium]
MSTDEITQVAAPAEPTKRRIRRGCFYYGCMCSILAVLLGVGACVGVINYGNSNLAPVCDRFLTLVDADKLKDAYAHTGPGWKESQSEEDFRAYITAVKSALGPLVRKQSSRTGVFMRNGATLGELSYEARYAKDDATLRFALEKVNDAWVIQALTIEAKALQDRFTCPSCGQKQKRVAKFCSNCGKPLLFRNTEQTSGSIDAAALETSVAK